MKHLKGFSDREWISLKVTIIWSFWILTLEFWPMRLWSNYLDRPNEVSLKSSDFKFWQVLISFDKCWYSPNWRFMLVLLARQLLLRMTSLGTTSPRSMSLKRLSGMVTASMNSLECCWGIWSTHSAWPIRHSFFERGGQILMGRGWDHIGRILS